MALAIFAKTRDVKQNEALRESGMVPAIVYGPGIEPKNISVEYVAFEKVYNEGGESTLVDFSIDGGAPVKVVVQDVQYHPVNEKILHVDFRQVNMNEEMEASVELEFVGEAPAVKLGGTLITNLEEMDIRCLPQNLVSSIIVDLGLLKTFDDNIYIKDLVLPAGIEAIGEPDTLVVKVAAPLSEEELKAMEESNIPADLSNIEVEKKGKKEEDEAAEADAAKKEEK